jgi:hypothetical protein
VAAEQCTSQQQLSQRIYSSSVDKCSKSVCATPKKKKKSEISVCIENKISLIVLAQVQQPMGTAGLDDGVLMILIFTAAILLNSTAAIC